MKYVISKIFSPTITVMVKQTNMYKVKISTNDTSKNIYCINYTMLVYLSCFMLGQLDSALASAIIPSAPIRQSSKLQHETCIDGVSCMQQSTTLKPEEYIALHVIHLSRQQLR